MRSGLLALRSVAAAAAVLVPAALAGPAHAGDNADVTVKVIPATARPGADVDLRVSGCSGTTGSARSKAFVADAELSGRDGKGKPLHGDTTVKSSLPSGVYAITVVCDGRDHHDVGSVHVTHNPPPPTPHAPVKAGGGGTAALSADAPSVAEQGPGTPHTVVGLVLAAAAAVAVAFRSARRRRTGAD
ncbi:hypothetical protein [Streptomyces sp. NPDC047928]|uniref:hypothetical protein n=1 Tax=unclassified Streptomyces TaxID=2593676 RepID=UPI0037127C6F